MIAYPDTSFLCALYRPQVNSTIAAEYATKMSEALHVSTPLLYEFRQSTRWQAWLHSKDSEKGFDRKTAQAVLATLQSNISSGGVVVVPIDWSDVASRAEHLSAQHTWTQGYRGFDLLHVATALHLGVTEFLSFDTKQRQLAKKEGLVVPF